jgi:predicted lipid-binding transport protein (Tim44 family)
MDETSQFNDKNRRRAAMGGLPVRSFLGRLVATVVGIGMFGVAIFLGAIFLAVVVGLALIAGLIISARVWWLKRKMQRYARDHGDLNAEYVEVTEYTRSDQTRISSTERDSQ